MNIFFRFLLSRVKTNSLMGLQHFVPLLSSTDTRDSAPRFFPLSTPFIVYKTTCRSNDSLMGCLKKRRQCRSSIRRANWSPKLSIKWFEMRSSRWVTTLLVTSRWFPLIFSSIIDHFSSFSSAIEAYLQKRRVFQQILWRTRASF